MKKFIFIILIIILIGALTACNSYKELDVNKLEKTTYNTSQQSTDVTLSVKEKTITSETGSITLIYTNLSNKEYTYGKEPHLEIEIDRIWYVVPISEGVAWDDIAYILSPNGSREDTLSIKDSYGRLNAGNYRIVKKLYSNGELIFSIAEFKIQK